MKKILSNIVILALLVIAPVSFSTTKIPNFDVPATRSSHLTESRKANIPFVQHTRKPEQTLFAFTPLQRPVAIPASPLFVHTQEIPKGRAPPAVPSV